MDKALKQRLVGASVLIALAVIILPMLLGGRPDRDSPQTRKIELPAQPPELSFETRRYPIGKQDSDQQKKAQASPRDEPVPQLPVPRAAVSTAEKSDAGDAPAEKPVRAEPATTVTDPAPPPPLPPPDNPPDSARYIVQVASFGAIENARRLAATLTGNGYAVMTDSVKSELGILHRVRVGPFSSQAQANRTVLELESKISGIKPRVMDLQPDKSAQITTPSDPLIRWIVQVGSFSSAANAEKLVASLRLDGLSAYQETVSSSGASIYRVRIGPYLEREEAIRVEQKIREKRALAGVVMSAD